VEKSSYIPYVDKTDRSKNATLTIGGCGKADVFIKNIGNIEIMIVLDRQAERGFARSRVWY
jgi:hypothetical protein